MYVADLNIPEVRCTFTKYYTYTLD